MPRVGVEPVVPDLYHLLGVAVAIAIVVKGSGARSIDRWLTRKAEYHRDA